MEALENVFSIKQCATPLYRLGTNHEKRVRVWFMSWCSWIEKKKIQILFKYRYNEHFLCFMTNSIPYNISVTLPSAASACIL